MGLRGNRDATDSWAGYLYQSTLGLVVTLEKIIELKELNQPIIGYFTYEDIEDFSIYIKDQNGNITNSSTYQAKFKKGETPGIYYPFLRSLHQARLDNQAMNYFLNISVNINFHHINPTELNLPDDFLSLFYSYRNGQSYLGGTECFGYLENLISKYCEINNTEPDSTRSERISAKLLAHIDQIIIETKEQRHTNPNYKREILFDEITDIIKHTGTELTDTLISSILRKRFNKALMIFLEPLTANESQKLDTIAKLVASLTDKEFISLVRKMQIHKELTSDIDLVSSFASMEELQDILFTVIKSISSPFDARDVVFKKALNVYRPSTLKIGRNAGANLKLEYLPKIKRNMSLHDIQGYFETKKIIIDGQTISDIWAFEITSSDVTKKDNKINEPELKALICVEDAIRELGDND